MNTGIIESLVIGFLVKWLITLAKLARLNLAGRSTQLSALLTASVGYILVAAQQGKLSTPYEWLGVGWGAVLAALSAIGWHQTLKTNP